MKSMAKPLKKPSASSQQVKMKRPAAAGLKCSSFPMRLFALQKQAWLHSILLDKAWLQAAGLSGSRKGNVFLILCRLGKWEPSYRNGDVHHVCLHMV